LKAFWKELLGKTADQYPTIEVSFVAKVLVTVGLGFIGSNLPKELRKRGHETWYCDTKVKLDLRHAIRTPLEKGIPQTVDWFKKTLCVGG
jgi:dTDP-D-glucose 4,6-dehydratase